MSNDNNEDVNIILNSDDKDIETSDLMEDDSNSKREPKNVKGRGKTSDIHENKYGGKDEVFESLDSEGHDGEPVKSVEGWNIIVTGLHPETQEDALHDLFSEYGNIINLTIAIQRRTGNVLGYALIEFETRDEAQKAINNTNGKEFMESPLSVDFSFVAPPKIAKTNRNNNRNSKRRR